MTHRERAEKMVRKALEQHMGRNPQAVEMQIKRPWVECLIGDLERVFEENSLNIAALELVAGVVAQDVVSALGDEELRLK